MKVSDSECYLDKKISNNKKTKNESIEFFLDNGTIHGLSHLKRKSHFLFKILWTIILLISACYCFYNIIKNLNEYLNYESVVKTNNHFNYPGQ